MHAVFEPHDNQAELARLASLFQAQRTAFSAAPFPSAAQRRAQLSRLKQTLLKHQDSLCAAISADFGHRSRHESQLLELFPSLAGIQHASSKLARWMKPRRRGVSIWFMPASNTVVPQPLGVVGIIVPWNYPLFLAIGPLTAALAAGNRAVIKISEFTPRFGEALRLALAESFDESQVAVVNGGVPVAQAFSGYAWDHLLFTGSTSVGKQVMRAAAENLTPVTLELGGKSPTIVLADADLDLAIPGAAQAIFSNSGQVCTAGSRLLVEASVYDEVTRGVARIAQDLRLGSGFDPAVQLGPLISARQLDRVSSLVARGIDEGAEPLCGGGRRDDKGYFFRPTVLTGGRADMQIAREEVFGPVVLAMKVSDPRQIKALANDTAYGLGASIWTRDLNKAHLLAAQLDCGTVWINTHNVLDLAMPFGGTKLSGLGREFGTEVIHAYTEPRAVCMRLQTAAFD